MNVPENLSPLTSSPHSLSKKYQNFNFLAYQIDETSIFKWEVGKKNHFFNFPENLNPLSPAPPPPSQKSIKNLFFWLTKKLMKPQFSNGKLKERINFQFSRKFESPDPLPPLPLKKYQNFNFFGQPTIDETFIFKWEFQKRINFSMFQKI